MTRLLRVRPHSSARRSRGCLTWNHINHSFLYQLLLASLLSLLRFSSPHTSATIHISFCNPFMVSFLYFFLYLCQSAVSSDVLQSNPNTHMYRIFREMRCFRLTTLLFSPHKFLL
ncbi:unnamed protein product [Albugo candida]|uniref:Uncharacterized protein n=1 Tax=Albugo candida TaxID=65357 RepID=A0A024G537_9STRA|nr:unnamed protein product [Albugo candida]|eukprot:CCI41683.1 unnamed protein product [Albugo candida]